MIKQGAILACVAALVACKQDSGQHSQARPASRPSGPPVRPSERAVKTSFAERRAAHRTKLLRHLASPQDFDPKSIPAAAERIVYQSDGRDLVGWFARPPGEQRVPALIYFHGGFAFASEDFDVVRPFVDAGFAVLLPTFRGENGNRGDFELYYGEVDDARQAIAWMRSRPDVDPDRVYAFGHSAGGVIAALVSFYPDTGLRMTGSAGGLYDARTSGVDPPFDPHDRVELELRSPADNGDQFQVTHIAYYGTDDVVAARGARTAFSLARATDRPLTIQELDGDHVTSLAPALELFRARITASTPGP